MAFGLLPTGVSIKTFEILNDEVDQSIADTFGASAGVSDADPLGQYNKIILSHVAELWELGEAVHNGMDPDQNTYAAQDAIATITGSIRDKATTSTATLTLTGDADTSVAVDNLVSVVGTEENFKTSAGAILVELTAWAITTAYVIGDRRSNDSACWVCTVAGTSAGSGGPQQSAVDFAFETTDGTVTWHLIGTGTAAVDVASTSVNTGPIAGALYTIKQIETPAGGWNSVNNLTVAITGTNLETNEGLRIKREQELATAGSTTHDALRAELLKVTGVTHVHIFTNNTDVTDAEGVPPHAVEALVLGGAAADIRETIFAGIADGIQTHGDISGTVTDSKGNDQTIDFSRPTEVLIFVDIDLEYDATVYPSDGNLQVETEVVRVGELLGTGADVNQFKLTNTLGSLGIGVLNLTDFDFEATDPPSGTTIIVITSRQVARFSLARTEVVVSTPVTP